MFLPKSVVLIEIYIIEATLVCATTSSIINTGLEDTETIFFVSNWFIGITTRATFYWVVIRVLEEVTRSFFLKFLSSFRTISWKSCPLVLSCKFHSLLLLICVLWITLFLDLVFNRFNSYLCDQGFSILAFVSFL